MLRWVLFFGWLAGGGYVTEIEQWRQKREASLKASDGWLTLTGLHWLREGRNQIEGQEFSLRGDRVVYAGKVLRPDTPEDGIAVGSKTLLVIKRGDRFAIRVRDQRSPFRKEFAGLTWYPVQPAYRVEARWIPYSSPQKRSVATVVNVDEQYESPGVAEFTLQGQKLRLEPVLSEGQYFFIFKDRTAGKTTYPAGRFLYAEPARDGRVILDFNKAYNPPCAFTPYATCPLPRKENHLPVAIEAGEKNYGGH